MEEKATIGLEDQESWIFSDEDGNVIYTNKSNRFVNVKSIEIWNFSYGEKEWRPEFELSMLELPALEQISIVLPVSGIDYSELFHAIDIQSLRKVKHISLLDYGIDSLPDWMKHCTGLTDLSMSCGKIRTLPPWFSHLKQLESFNADDSIFEEIPTQLFNLSNIKSLRFNRGHHITVIPDEIKNFQQLNSLGLNYTTFSYVSAELFRLPHIQHLNFAISFYPNMPLEIWNAIMQLQRKKPNISIWWLDR